jgi:hypothetical protein
MTSTTLESLTVRCFAGVLDAATHCQHCPIWYSRIQYSTNPYAITLARRAAWAALLPRALVGWSTKGARYDRTNSGWHHVLITPCMQPGQGLQ